MAGDLVGVGSAENRKKTSGAASRSASWRILRPSDGLSNSGGSKEMAVDCELKPGARFRMSPLGAERCPRLAGCIGTVVHVLPTKSSFRVLVDGTKTVRSIHGSYIMPVVEAREAGQVNL
jgi:hypothetical protein